MLEIAKKIYNGITDQRFFRLLILVSMFFVYMELTTQAERMRNAAATLVEIELETEYLNTGSSQIRLDLNSIEYEVERISGYASEISDYTRGIRDNTY